MDLVSLLALVTDPHPTRAVDGLRGVASALDRAEPPGKFQERASSASHSSGSNSANTVHPWASPGDSDFRRKRSSSDNGLAEIRTLGSLPRYLASPVRSV